MVGRNWKLNEPLGRGEVYITSSLASLLHVSVGSVIYGRSNASIAGREVLNETVLQWACPSCATGTEHSMVTAETVWAPYTVKGIFKEMDGKFRRDEESFIVLVGIDTFFPHLAHHMSPTVLGDRNELERNLTKTKVLEHVSTVIINLAPPRIDIYLSSKYSVVHDRLIAFSNRILFKLGFAQVFVDMPVLRGLGGTEMVALFLGLILNVIIFILLFLSVVLIYSLLMISVETRTFEMGILRMIGMARPSLISLLLVQAFAYAIPAWIIGMLSALVVYAGAASVVTNITQAAIPKLLTGTGFAIATLMGFIVPVASSVLPIRSALGKNLQDSLDTKHNKTKAVEISLRRGEDSIGVSSWTHLLIGIGLSLFGGVIYYVLPLGLLGQNLALLMNIFLFILLGMLLGLVMIALNLQHMLERLLALIFFFWESRGIRNLVVKNLVAHRKRNQKTSILYALSLGFIIFINIAYNIQVSSISEDKKRDIGAVIMAYKRGNMDPSTLHIPSLSEVKQIEMIKGLFPNIVEDFAWVTKTLRDAYPLAVNSRVSNLGRWNQDLQFVFGVSPNFFRVAMSEYITVTDAVDKKMDFSYLADKLYSREGSSRALLGSMYQEFLGVKPGDPILIGSEATVGTTSSSTDASGGQDGGGSSGNGGTGGGVGGGGGIGGGGSAVDAANVQKTNEFIASAEAFLSSAPRFTFSAFPLLKSQDLVVSLPTFNALSGFYYKSVEDIPLERFLVKFKKGVTNKEINMVSDWLEARLSDRGSGVWDFRNEMEPFEVANKAIAYFFTFTTVVAMAISFFSLMSSMYTNIREQTKEIGVIRALGIPKSWVYRIYIYEAFLLVVTSSLLGIIIGTVTSYTMNSQQSLFTQLPLAFKFPYLLLFAVLSCSTVFALLASWSPIRAVLSNRIVQILRGL